MTRDEYDRYLACFNARDYRAMCGFYAPDVVLRMLGYAIVSRQGILDFYGFFHRHVRETIRITRFVSDSEFLAIEAPTRLEAIEALTAEDLKRAGFGRLVTLDKGMTVELQNMIHYDLRGGLFTEIRVGVYDPGA
ncbi:MAG TPA: nuclear transport factor 2 family protein [Caulobacteraceae bacterium]